MSLERTIFDRVVERKGTDSLKYDFASKRGKPEDVLPMWVADMDFRTSKEIIGAITVRAAHGIYGYTESNDDYYEAVTGWMKRRHGWEVKSEWLIKTPGVVFALAMAVKAYSKEGESVLIQQPVYYPFSEVILDNDRKLVSSDLYLGEDGKYHIDFDDFEAKIIENQVKLFLLCSPHNPVSRVWTREELIRLGDICCRHHVVVVSDEIHEDFIFGDRKHYVFADLKDEFREISVVCTSPGKTFNLAGLQVSNIFIPNEELRRKFKKQVAAAGYSQIGTFGITACKEAYESGDKWCDSMLEYLAENITFMKEFFKRELPQLRMVEPEGTCLVWVDFRDLGLSDAELESLIVEKAHLWLDSGAIFGEAGKGFERFNIACPRCVLEQCLIQLKQGIADYFYMRNI